MDQDNEQQLFPGLFLRYGDGMHTIAGPCQVFAAEGCVRRSSNRCNSWSFSGCVPQFGYS